MEKADLKQSSESTFGVLVLEMKLCEWTNIACGRKNIIWNAGYLEDLFDEKIKKYVKKSIFVVFITIRKVEHSSVVVGALALRRSDCIQMIKRSYEQVYTIISRHVLKNHVATGKSKCDGLTRFKKQFWENENVKHLVQWSKNLSLKVDSNRGDIFLCTTRSDYDYDDDNASECTDDQDYERSDDCTAVALLKFRLTLLNEESIEYLQQVGIPTYTYNIYILLFLDS